ncbi:type VII secretion target [Actinokineospora sp. HUAS TT18]|uniref:type VII secretion target n=1 Tax=Actinokineospora sp. HUAS TT18 TaxID=3447451 RepID=UPI003F51F7BC
MTANIDIRPEPVRQAAADLDAVAADARKNIDIELGRSEPAAAGLAGFSVAASVTACSEAWEKHLVQLVNDTAGAAEKLRSTATDYAELEERLAGALDSMDTGE